jgi:hypothetical protein
MFETVDETSGPGKDLDPTSDMSMSRVVWLVVDWKLGELEGDGGRGGARWVIALRQAARRRVRVESSKTGE